MRLVQYKESEGRRGVATVSDYSRLRPLRNTESVYQLVFDSIRSETPLEALVGKREASGEALDYETIISKGWLLPPIDHPSDSSRCLVSGTGLDHLGSALARDAMHEGSERNESTDSMKMFRLGLEGGKPKPGTIGAQPEWFYKGDGSCIVAPGAPLKLPYFALDGGEEAEVVGLYVISDYGEPYRVGFALGNEFSDHIMEKQNYLYLAHSKLRECSFGPELLIGELPNSLSGTVRVVRQNRLLWEGNFLTGEGNMTHSIANIEYHHFKYEQFRRAGDVHCHFFGASVLSFSAGVKAEPGDVFEISSPVFGRPLVNTIVSGAKPDTLVSVRKV